MNEGRAHNEANAMITRSKINDYTVHAQWSSAIAQVLSQLCTWHDDLGEHDEFGGEEDGQPWCVVLVRS